MRKRASIIIFLLTALFICFTFTANAGFLEESKVESAREVLSEIMKIPEKRIPPVLFKDTYGIAVIPGVIKLGFVVGGRFGQGILVVRTESGEWRCVEQDFEAGDSDYEAPFGEPIDPPTDEAYEPFDMVQPKPKDEAIEELKRVAAKLQEGYNDG